MIRKKAATKTAKKAAKKPASRAPGRAPVREDWRGRTLAMVRAIIQSADPEIVEERKWVKAANPEGVPVWSHDGIICTGEIYKSVVKLTFAKGASLADPSRLFNSSLDGNVRRAIDIREDDTIDAAALRKLVQAAVAQNLETVEHRGRK